MNNNSYLAKDFTFFSAFILIFVLIICFSIGVYSHYSYFYKENSKLYYDANQIINRLDDILYSVENHILNVDNKLAMAETHENNVIKKIFTSIHYNNIDDSPEWIIFSWITPENKILTSSVYSSINKSDYITLKRDYLKDTKKYPGKLFFDKTDSGLVSKQKILPAGFGVVDTEQNYIGTIGVGIGIDRLVNDLQRSVNGQEVVFILLDDSFAPVLKSNSIGQKELNLLLGSRVVKNFAELSRLKKGGFIRNFIRNDQFSFEYYQSSSKYPFHVVVGMDLSLVKDLYWQQVLPRIFELLLLALIFIIILFYFRLQIIKPILIMSKMAKKIASGEKVSLKETNYEEFNDLIDRLREIQLAKQQLELAKGKTEKVNLILEQKVKERTQDLENALAIKTDFLNRVSHEVRTPVQGITSISESLTKNWDEFAEEKRRELASAVAFNSKRLFSLVSNILDFSTFNAGYTVFNFKHTDFIELINDTVEECKSLYLNKKDLKIVFSQPHEKIMLNIDSEKITQVIRNIITNSIKFSNSGVIDISVNKLNKYIELVIKDQGVGVSKEELDSIFDPFVQSVETKGKYQGAGLGLSICKKIIEGHEGEIWAEKNHPKGMIIRVKLKLLEQQNIDSDIKIEKSRKAINILLIDDEPTCSMSMDLLLSGTNVNLNSQYDGKSGLSFLKENFDKIDLIFLDLMMPDMHGSEVLKIIKSDPYLENIPVVIQSGTNDNKEIEMVLKAGADKFIRKPYTKQQIIDLINELA